MKNDKNCYGQLLEQFEDLKTRVDLLHEKISILVGRYEDNLEVEEGCPDVLESNQEAYDRIRDICLDSIFDVEPKGEA